MSEVTIPLADLRDALAMIERKRTAHPERDGEPLYIGINIGVPHDAELRETKWSITHNTGAFGGLITIKKDAA